MDEKPYAPPVTVIIPVRNGSRTIAECLSAVQGQSYPGEFEILVVDNNSTDVTPDIVSRFKNARLLRQTAVQGSYASRNFGAAQAKGEILAFTDADCTPATNWLTHLAAPFCNPEMLAVGGMVFNARAENLVESFLGEVNVLGKYYNAPAQFLRPLITANVAIRKSAFEEFQGFNANLYTGADVDFAWRIQLQRPDCIRYATEAVVFHHHRSNVKSMFLQYRRHGFGEVFLDAIYHRHPGYPRTLRAQLIQITRQFKALLIYQRSFVFHLVKYGFRPDRYSLVKPLFWTVAESGSLWGKLQALWVTRGLRHDPSVHQWQDPGG